MGTPKRRLHLRNHADDGVSYAAAFLDLRLGVTRRRRLGFPPPRLAFARRGILQRARRTRKCTLQDFLQALVGFVGVTLSWHAGRIP